jgi:hypothetical protein
MLVIIGCVVLLFFLLKDLNFALDLAPDPDPLDERVGDDEADFLVDDFPNRLFDGDDGAFVADLFFRLESEEFDPVPELVHLAWRPDPEHPAVEALGLDGVVEHHEERFSPVKENLKSTIKGAFDWITFNVIIQLMLSNSQRQEDVIPSNSTENCVWSILSFS